MMSSVEIKGVKGVERLKNKTNPNPSSKGEGLKFFLVSLWFWCKIGMVGVRVHTGHV